MGDLLGALRGKGVAVPMRESAAEAGRVVSDVRCTLRGQDPYFCVEV